MMYPNKFVESLAPTGAQLKSYMKTMFCLLHWNTTEIPILVVVNWFLCKERFVMETEHKVKLFIITTKYDIRLLNPQK